LSRRRAAEPRYPPALPWRERSRPRRPAAPQVESLLGITAELLGPRWKYLGLIATLPPICGYVGAARFDPRLVLVYACYSLLMVAYNVFTTYLSPTIWRLLLLLVEVYMCRIILRFFGWLRRVPAEGRSTYAGTGAHAPNEQQRAQSTLSARSALVPW